MDPDALKQVLVPLALFASVVACFKFVFDGMVRYRLAKDGVSPEQLGALLAGEGGLRRQSALRWGITLLAAGAALGLNQALGWQQLGAGGIGLLCAAAGLAQIVYYVITRQPRA
jgi:hypothetical protein